MIVADVHTAEGGEGLAGVGATFVAHAQTVKAVEPDQSALDHPAGTTKMPAVVWATPGQTGNDSTRLQRHPAAGVAFVRMEPFMSVAWPSTLPGDGRHSVNALLQHLEIIHIDGQEDSGQGQTTALYGKVVLRACAAEIDRTRTSFLVLFCARIKQAQLQSRRSASGERCKSVQCNTSPTPCAYQPRSRSQCVMSKPHPILDVSNSQDVSVHSTKMMPSSQRDPRCVASHHAGATAWTVITA